MTSPPDSSHTHAVRSRNRGMLLALALVFFGTFALAGILRFSGWRPHGLKNKGELLQPAVDARDLHLQVGDGQPYEWNPIERRWRLLVLPPNACGAACDKLVKDVDLVWQLLGAERDRVDVLWGGTLPAVSPGLASRPRTVAPVAALRARLPRADDPKGAVVYVLDPNGFVVLRYAPGFDPADLRTDMARLLKLR